MATFTVHLVHDASFSVVNRWFADGSRIRVRFRVASGPELVHEFPIAGSKLRLHADNDWKAGPMKVEGTLGEIEFVLRGAPDHVSDALRDATR